MLELLGPRPGGRYLDATVGPGGHSRALLEASAPDGTLVGLDRDAEALALAAERLAPFGDRARLVHGDFRQIDALAAREGWAPFDGILFDLGVSSAQLASAERGFAFARDGPLDMRMDRGAEGPTAADLVARLPERNLERILREYGEERWARRIARAIVGRRARAPLLRTGELAALVAGAIPRRAWPPRIHPATRTFQALRIAVNDELRGLGDAVRAATGLLGPGGRLAVMAFHSLEDREVKQALRALAGGEPPRLRLLTRRPLVPGADEIRENPRARSAKLRAAERCGGS